jgi:SAM-dependent methyltransferase
MIEESINDPQITALLDELTPIRNLVERISLEPRPVHAGAAAAVVERYRHEMYRAMFGLGAAIHQFEGTGPTVERVAAAREAVLNLGRAWFPTNPFMVAGYRAAAKRMAYFELVETILSVLSAGSELVPMLLSDYAINSVIGRAFRNRHTLAVTALREEIAQRHAAGHRPLQVYSLNYLGGSELAHLADDPRRLEGLRIHCIDASGTAVRHAEQTLGPLFKRRITFQMADPERWLNGPTCPREEACVVYCVSLLEQLDSASVVRILRGVHRLLREGGAVIMGSVTDAAPIEEQRLRAWILSWDWRYRGEDEWRELFAQTPFRAEDLRVDYEPLRVGLVIRARRPSGA